MVYAFVLRCGTYTNMLFSATASPFAFSSVILSRTSFFSSIPVFVTRTFTVTTALGGGADFSWFSLAFSKVTVKVSSIGSVGLTVTAVACGLNIVAIGTKASMPTAIAIPNRVVRICITI